MLYNVPARTAVNLEAATTLRLTEIPNIVALKEASASMSQVGRRRRRRPGGLRRLQRRG